MHVLVLVSNFMKFVLSKFNVSFFAINYFVQLCKGIIKAILKLVIFQVSNYTSIIS